MIIDTESGFAIIGMIIGFCLGWFANQISRDKLLEQKIKEMK
jgi:hypothetical protein